MTPKPRAFQVNPCDSAPKQSAVPAGAGEVAPALQVAGLSVVPFGASNAALNNLSFSVSAGERVLLLGPSGAGKSTLLLTLSGVLEMLESFEITGTYTQESTGLLLQNAIDASVGETLFREVAFGAENASIEPLSIARLVESALAATNIALPLDRRVETLSGGELQRVCLAGLVTMQPKVLLLDEPTSMLDPISADAVRQAIAQYLSVSGATCIIAEHIFEPWLPLITRILVLDECGNMVADGAVHEVLGSQRQKFEAWGLWSPGFSPLPIKPVDDSKSGTGGTITALVGPSGAGKTTWLKNKLAEFEEQVPAGEIGWSPQNPAMISFGSTALQTAAGSNTKVLQSNARRLLQDLGLGERLNQNPHTLSGGEQRRLALASALVNNPTHVVLDEPTVGLDTHNWRKTVATILAAKKRGAKIWVATHDAQLLQYCDQIIEIPPAQGPVQEPPAKPGEPTKPARRLQDGKSISPLGAIAISLFLLAGSFWLTTLTQALVALLLVASMAALQFSLWLQAQRQGNSAVLAMAARAKGLWFVLIGLASILFSNFILSDHLNIFRALYVTTRIAFFALPAFLLAAAIKPSVLADQLGQLLHLPARPVIAAAIALNRVGQMRNQWLQLVWVRKIRGLTLSGSITAKFAELRAITFGLLLEAIRSATSTSVAMEARGFSAPKTTGNRRTWAIPAKLHWMDVVGFAAALAVLLVAKTF